MDRSQPTSPERAQSLARSERRKKKKKCQCSKLKFNLSDLICKINTAERSKPPPVMCDAATNTESRQVQTAEMGVNTGYDLNFPNLDGVLLDAPELPEGNGLTYRMSAKNCEYVVVACGRWALPNVDWTDWLQIAETVEVNHAINLILRLMRFVKAEHMFLAVNHRWLDLKSPLFCGHELGDLVFHLREALFGTPGHKLKSVSFVGFPRQPYTCFHRFDERARSLFGALYFSTSKHLQQLGKEALEPAGLPYLLTDSLTAFVINKALEEGRRTIVNWIEEAKQKSMQFQSPLAGPKSNNPFWLDRR